MGLRVTNRSTFREEMAVYSPAGLTHRCTPQTWTPGVNEPTALQVAASAQPLCTCIYTHTQVYICNATSTRKFSHVRTNHHRHLGSARCARNRAGERKGINSTSDFWDKTETDHLSLYSEKGSAHGHHRGVTQLPWGQRHATQLHAFKLVCFLKKSHCL